MRSPAYPGGAKAMDQFVKDNLVYPDEAIRQKIAGTVSLIADVDYKGNVIKTIVKKGIGFGCDEEASRVVGMMKFESIRYRGMRVVFHKTIQIHFNIPGIQPVNPEISYSYQPAKSNDKPGNLEYTVTLS